MGEIIRDDPPPPKVKVIVGPSLSIPPRPIQQELSLSLPQIDRRRALSNTVYRDRMDSVENKMKNEIKKLFEPYAVNS